MNVKNIEKESSKAKITVEIERDLMDSGANQAYLKARKDIQLPGFRKGKAPRKLIESIYGAHVFYEDGLEEIFPQVYQFAVVEQELKAVGRPSLTSMDIAEDGSVTIVLETELYPEVTLGQYRGLEVEKVEPSVTDEEVEAEYQSLADTYHMELEKVRGLVEAESLKQDLLTRKAVKLIAEAAVPVAPKPEEETKTEE